MEEEVCCGEKLALQDEAFITAENWLRDRVYGGFVLAQERKKRSDSI